MAEDDWIFETDGGGGGGAFDSGDAEDVEFDDSEAEVFEVDEIDFSEDTDVEVFDAEPLLDEIKAAKASCAESSVEASENSAILWGVAAAAGGAGMVGPAAVAGLGAAAQSYMGAMAQECANDPRERISVLSQSSDGCLASTHAMPRQNRPRRMPWRARASRLNEHLPPLQLLSNGLTVLVPRGSWGRGRAAARISSSGGNHLQRPNSRVADHLVDHGDFERSTQVGVTLYSSSYDREHDSN